MYVALFAAYPAGRDKRGNAAHEPAVRVVVRRTRFAGNRAAQVVAVA